MMAADEIDARVAFLARAGAADALFSQGVISVDEAFEPLVEPFMAIVAPVECDTCGSTPCTESSFCAACRKADAEVRRSQGPRNAPVQPTPQTVVEALWHVFRTDGLAALKRPENVERLSRCDAAAKKELKRRIATMGARKEIAA